MCVREREVSERMSKYVCLSMALSSGICFPFQSKKCFRFKAPS